VNSNTSQHTQPPIRVQLASALAVIIPMAMLTTWMYLIRDSAPAQSEFFLGPLLFGGGMIFWILFLHIVVCRDCLESLGFRVSGFWLDVVTGIGMGVGFLILKSLIQPFLQGLFPPRAPSEEILQLIHSVISNKWLLGLWLGPVVWIGIAGFEETWRCFVLRRFWNVFNSRTGQWIALLAVSALVGAAHGYQGPAAAISIGIKSILMGWYFMATGRARTLIVSHAVYDSVQIIWAVIMIRG